MPTDISPEVFLQTKYIENSQTAQFTVPDAETAYIIDKAVAVNVSGGTQNFSVHLVAEGESASDENLVIDNRSVAAGAGDLCPELVGQIMAPGEFLSAIASSASSINLRICGRRVR